MSETPSFCEECGAPLEPGIRFCEECGQAIESAEPPRLTIPVPLQWGALVGGVAAIGVVAVVVALVVSGVFDSGDDANSQGRTGSLLFATPTGPPGARPAATQSPSAPVGFETAEDAIGDFYGVSGAMPYCDDASLAPGELCASFDEAIDDVTLTFLIGETFSEFFDTVTVRQLADESWLVDEVQEFIFSLGFDTAEEAVYAAFAYGPETPIINCNSGQAGASNPCWDTPTYLSVSEGGDLVYLFRPQFNEWYWVLVKEGSDRSFEVADIVLAEGEFELFNSPFAAAREFDTPEDAIGIRLAEVGIQPPVGDCNDPSLEPGAFCVCPYTLVDESTVLYLVGQTFSEFFDALLVEQLLDGGFAADFSSFDFESNLSCLDPSVQLPWDAG